MKPLPAALAACLLAVAALAAGPRRHVLGNTEIRDLPRAANGRDYQLFIALPSGYADAPDRRYPVLYLCDGYWDFTLINGFYGNLMYDRWAPPFIIVGLGYQHASANAEYDVLRRYDYTPAADAGDPRGECSGHAAEFLGVVEREIIPYVEREFRADPSWRVLSGNSLGGLFSLYAMLARPGLFQAHIACSPAAPPALFALEEKFHAGGGRPAARLFLTGAEQEDAGFLANIVRFKERLESRRYPGLVLRWRLIDGEGHTSTKSESYTRGLRFAFAPLKP